MATYNTNDNDYHNLKKNVIKMENYNKKNQKWWKLTTTTTTTTTTT